MATLGGNDPARKPKRGILNMLIIAPKHPGSAPTDGKGGDPASTDKMDAEKPMMGGMGDKMPAAATGKSMRPGDAQFVDQTQTCSQCEYFDASGNDGIGACQKGVPEADFNSADPGSSRCRFFEDTAEEKAETPQQESAEQEEPMNA